MNLETIQRTWEKDSHIDDVLLAEASLDISRPHAKYLSIYNDVKLLLIKAQQELKLVKHKQYLYYSGKEVPEDAEPFNYKIMKSDVPNWVSIDEKVMRCEAKVEYNQTMLDALSEILKQINQRNYVIKNAIDWRRFVSGG